MGASASTGFQSVAFLACCEVTAIFSAMVGVVFYDLLTGRIRLDGLLREKSGEGTKGPFSIARLQGLLVTLAASGGLLLEALRGHVAPNAAPLLLDHASLVALFGSSHAVYLSTKFYSRIWKPESPQ